MSILPRVESRDTFCLQNGVMQYGQKIQAQDVIKHWSGQHGTTTYAEYCSPGARARQFTHKPKRHRSMVPRGQIEHGFISDTGRRHAPFLPLAACLYTAEAEDDGFRHRKDVDVAWQAVSESHAQRPQRFSRTPWPPLLPSVSLASRPKV